MKQEPAQHQKHRSLYLLLSIVLVFCIFGTIIFAVTQKTSREMSRSAIQSLSESLDLLKSMIETTLRSEAEFQTLLAQELAQFEDPEAYILRYQKNQTMVKLSLIRAGQTEGISSTGEAFTGEELDFSAGGRVEGLDVSQSYVNYMGTWAYTIRCPVERDGQTLGTLYVEYVYDTIDRSLPNGFYNQQASLYVMDAESERFVLKPQGMGQRDAGHLNLDDFYRANNIVDAAIRAEVADCLDGGRNVLFYHDIQGEHALNYMWPVNGGTIFLVGYVPVSSILQEQRTVNQSILILIASMLAAFLACILLYSFNRRQQDKLRKEREQEQKLHSQQLAAALRAAQAASESKTTFLSNMSHDIRTPMNAVLGFTTLLAKDADDPDKVRAYTQKITASGQHLLGLINDILDVSKIESGKVVLNYEKFALNDVVASLEAIILPMARARKQEFHIEVTGIRYEYLMGDEMRLNQVLINLLSNAVKYTPEGGRIWLRIIGLRSRSSQYERIRIEVEDTGYGMTPEYLKTIFDPFTRAENSTTNKVQGTGLGMAITKSIVEMMGGTVEVTSELDKGSLFRVELELRILEEQVNRAFWQQHGIERVLLVTRDAGCAENIRMLLESTGVGLEQFDSLCEAAARAGAQGETGDGSAAGSSTTAPDGVGEDAAAGAANPAANPAGDSTGADAPAEPAAGPRQLILLDWETCAPNDLPPPPLPASAALIILAEPDTDLPEQLTRLGHAAVLAKPFFVSAFQKKVAELWAAAGHQSAAPAPEGEGLAGLHFLAAEDNEINAEILADLLEIEGASCEIVANGRLALERFERAAPGEFDAILMDVQMPVMNGHEATRAIRALPRPDAARIPIIAMTANAFAEDEKAALDAGMNAHVAKPLDMQILKEVVRQCASSTDAP